jgi:hypothetical protein
MLVNQKVLFSIEECNLIIDLSKSNLKEWVLKDRSYKSYAIDYSKSTEWIFNKLKLFFEFETNLKVQKLKNQIHFHRFNKEDWFDKHNDARDNRVYAIGVLLNNSFKGGDFKLYYPVEQTLNKVIGNTYVFNVEIEHEITPITEGERYSLLWFLQNEHIKFQTNKLI